MPDKSTISRDVSKMLRSWVAWLVTGAALLVVSILMDVDALLALGGAVFAVGIGMFLMRRSHEDNGDQTGPVL